MLLAMFVLFSCKNGEQADGTKSGIDEHTRIVSLSGTTTEILCELGLQSKIVAVDVTSSYPAEVNALPKVGHNRNISAESVLAQKPTLVIGLKDNVKPEFIEQMRSANVRLLVLDLEHSVAGSKKLVRQIADTLGTQDKATAICERIDADMKGVQPLAAAPKVLFIYARGAGTMMVAGRNTASTSMIEIAGAQNTVNDFEDFKPLTPEALVAANPDVILLFDKGLESLGGIEGLLKIPGVEETNAGKNKSIIEMDGQLLTGFGPRIGKAATELANKLNALKKS
jgi:iron complex transport system substrate-binding protein